ncbi:MAG: TIGR02646 family protein [Alphaproteobacteria bacterium]|uniref:TIGR02646 family protein n=1 Tax=Candidatus Nitrobium versatile TaxID=2884831 RepID=A0A953J9D9_9BACT|nr:TIGR02646 family protein [Candidatus Nitrobium versatile]
MKTIVKSTLSPCLASQPVAQEWYDFMRTQCHAEVGDNLRQEQQFLCCYCESEIGEDDSHIEHMVPRSIHNNLTYEYSNLAASCNGGAVDHCGHFKDDNHRNPGYRYDASKFCPPHDANTCRLFSYLSDGDVIPAQGLSQQDRDKAEYMIGYLGLTCSRLSGRRHSHAKNLIQTLGSNPDAELVQWAMDYYLTPSSDGKLKAFISLSRTLLAQ